MRKIFILFICFVLCSCGEGMFAYQTENLILLNEKDAKMLKSGCGASLIAFGCAKEFDRKYLYTQTLDKYRILVKLDVAKNTKVKVLSYAALPLIPPPPIIPTFFFPAINHETFCGGGFLKVNLSFISDSESNLKDINIDINDIYILKNNKKIYAKKYINNIETYQDKSHKNNYYINYFTIDFPILCKETNDTLIFIENVKVNGEEIKLPVGKIVYGSNLVFFMGYFVNN